MFNIFLNEIKKTTTDSFLWLFPITALIFNNYKYDINTLIIDCEIKNIFLAIEGNFYNKNIRNSEDFKKLIILKLKKSNAKIVNLYEKTTILVSEFLEQKSVDVLEEDGFIYLTINITDYIDEYDWLNIYTSIVSSEYSKLKETFYYNLISDLIKNQKNNILFIFLKKIIDKDEELWEYYKNFFNIELNYTPELFTIFRVENNLERCVDINELYLLIKNLIKNIKQIN